MSAVLPVEAAATKSSGRSENVWQAAWRRFRSDRVGMVSLVIVAAFLLLIALAALGFVAKDWQKEVGVPNAPPTLMGPGAAQEAAEAQGPAGPNVDLSDIDPRRATPNGPSGRRSSAPKKRRAPTRCLWAVTGSAATCSPRR
jgi:oligopeptide transport system permease protein